MMQGKEVNRILSVQHVIDQLILEKMSKLVNFTLHTFQRVTIKIALITIKNGSIHHASTVCAITAKRKDRTINC